MQKITWMPACAGLTIALALCAAPAIGADYFIYRDGAGKIILSNLAAVDRPLGRAPGELTVVKQYDWRDASDAEIAATERANQITARTNALNDLAAETSALARATDRLALATGSRQQATVEINAPDIVVQSATINSQIHIPHAKFRGRR